MNVSILAVFALSISASAMFPILLLSLYWKPLATWGAIAGGSAGLLSAVAALVLRPDIWVTVLGHTSAAFPAQYLTILAMPLAFGSAILISLLRPERCPATGARSG
ncbi:MAG: hypothetical protein EXQ84_06055 [Rhodospirillaceae bacterium]|nr:hypothetical protein [Rhodospirillaceae bacterium]